MGYIRDAPIGQIIRYITKKKVLQYPEEKADFECPSSYTKNAAHLQAINEAAAAEKLHTPATEVSEPAEKEEEEEPEELRKELEKVPTAEAEGPHLDALRSHSTRRSQIEKVGTRTALSRSTSQKDLENQFSMAIAEKGPSQPIVPDKLDDGTILVDWYTTDDPENPQNWPLRKKLFVTFQIW
jgi:MFS transporter, DHA1 family, multidrug resistance protein